jgi:hypothetical protein
MLLCSSHLLVSLPPKVAETGPFLLWPDDGNPPSQLGV